MIEFKKQYSLKNGNKINKRNWHKVVAVSSIPNTNFLGNPAIEKMKAEKGAYFNTWKLVKEDRGYIFIEINAGTGISGWHKTYREAIWTAIRDGIKVYIPD